MVAKGDQVRVVRRWRRPDFTVARSAVLISGTLVTVRPGEGGSVRGVYPSGTPGHTHFTLAPFREGGYNVFTTLEQVTA